MRKPEKLKFIKRTWAKGQLYLYFQTGRLNEKGKPVLAPLPPMNDPSFGGIYAAHLGHRNRGTGEPVMDVRKLVAMYQASPHWKDLSDGTRRLYSIYLTQFLEDFGPARPDMLERKDIALAIDSRASTPGAANSLLRTIRSLYLWARKRGHLSCDPCKDIELLDVGEWKPWPTKLLTAALACDDDRVRLATHLLYYTAQRIGDISKMRWDAIEHGAIFVRQEKTGKELYIPIHSKLAAELAKQERLGETIITSANGKAIKPITIRNSVQDWARDQGQDIVPHGLRKNAVNALLEAGCSVPQTAAISGQSMQMVEQYASKRNQAKIGRAAMTIWDGTDRENSNGENMP